MILLFWKASAFFCWDLFAKWKVANSLDGFRLEKICPCIIFSTRFRFCFQRTSGWTVLFLLVKLRGKGWGIGWNQVEESWTIKNQVKSPTLDKTDPAKMDLYIKIQIDPNTMFIKTLFWPSHWMCGVTLNFFCQGLNKKFDHSKLQTNACKSNKISCSSHYLSVYPVPPLYATYSSLDLRTLNVANFLLQLFGCFA